jgi:hypothetical protein
MVKFYLTPEDDAKVQAAFEGKSNEQMIENCRVDDCQKRWLVAERDALVKALELFADPASWRLGGSCDPNSGAFCGLQMAQQVLIDLGKPAS